MLVTWRGEGCWKSITRALTSWKVVSQASISAFRRRGVDWLSGRWSEWQRCGRPQTLQHHVVPSRGPRSRAAGLFYWNRRRPLRDGYSSSAGAAQPDLRDERGSLPPVALGIRQCNLAHGRHVRASNLSLRSERMGKGRIALIGDAAFVARPHCGAGVAKAADDAVSLATALEMNEDIETAVGAFSAERIRAGKAAVDWAAHLGSYFQMDKTGHRLADFSDRPPISAEYIIKHTAIELSEVRRT